MPACLSCGVASYRVCTTEFALPQRQINDSLVKSIEVLFLHLISKRRRVLVAWTPLPDQWPSGDSGATRNGLPVWKWESWKSSTAKWAQLAVNGQVWMNQALKPLRLIQFWSWINSLLQLLALWGNKNWPPQYESQQAENLLEQNALQGLQMVQFECPMHWNCSVTSNFEIR